MIQPKHLQCLDKVVLTLVIILFFACNKQDSIANANTDTTANDSIFKWIDQGKDADFSEETRALLLDKAHAAASKSTNDTLKPKYYSNLSNAYLKLKDSALFMSTNKESIDLAKIVNDSITHAGAHWDLGTFYNKNKLPDSAYYHYREAHLLYDAVGDDKNAGRTLYNMASSQVDVKDYTGAEINTINAIKLFKPIEENKRLYLCYNLLGTISTELKEYQRALDYFEIAENYLNQLASKADRNHYSASLQNNVGNVYKEQGDYVNATKNYTNALHIDDSLQYKRPTAYAQYLINLSTSRLNLGDTLGLKKDLKVAKQIYKDQGDNEGLSFAYYAFAEYFLSQKDTVQALYSAQLAREFAEKSSNNKRLLASLRLLPQIDPLNSFTYTQEYTSVNDRLLLEERRARDKFTRISFDTNEIEAANRELARKQQIWTGIALGIFLLGIAVYIIINQRARNQALRFQQQQQASNQEIFDLMLSQKQKIEETKKREQKRISEELHDGVLGKMLGARMVLTGLNKRSNEEAIEERGVAIAALKDVEGEVRAISHELSHAAYQKMNNFIHSIQELLGNVGSANNITPTFEFDEVYNWDSLKGDIKINLYRIVQESLQNAVKHAECKNILVSFVRQNNSLHVTIKDDGKGFKTNGGKKGIGMRNIESRVAKLNGTWEVNSIVDKGTSVTLHIPLNGGKEPIEIEITEQNLQNIE